MEESGGTHQIGHRSNACQVALMMLVESVRFIQWNYHIQALITTSTDWILYAPYVR